MSKMMDVYSSVRNIVDTFTYEYNGNSIELHVNKFLSLSDKMHVASEIFKMCFTTDENGEYKLYTSFIEPLKRIFFINLYCIDFQVNLEEDGDACFDFVMNTDFFDKLVNAVGNDEFYKYSCCIDDYIDFKMQEYYSSVSSSMVDKLLADLIAKVNKLIPDNIDSDKYSKFIERVSNMTDKDIVKNVLSLEDDTNVGEDNKNS